MLETDNKITGSLRIRKRDQDEIKAIGNGSFSKGFEKILEFYRINNKESAEDVKKQLSTKQLLELLRNRISDLQKEFGKSGIVEKKIERYKKEYSELLRYYEANECEETDEVISILRGRLAN